MVANLVKLEFIYVRSESKVHVPSVVLRMVKLRHLVMKPEAEFEEDCSSNITEMTNLRTLSGVHINGKKDEDILRCCPHLHKLKCIFSDGTKFPDLSFLAELESLRMSFGEKGLSAKILSSKITFPSTIKNLSLLRSRLPWEMMSIIGRLPNLEVLKLEDYDYDGKGDAWVTGVWVTRDGEFQKLKCLKLYECRDLMLWISCSQHFPVLECLLLRRCFSLVEIPSDFGNIPTLQRIGVIYCNCRDEAYLSALHIGKQIQVDIVQHEGPRNDEFIQELRIHSAENLMNMLRCMEEYFKAGGSEMYISKFPITNQTQHEATDKDSDAFVLRDVLSYMEQYFQAEGSIKKLTIIDQMEEDTTTNDDDEPRCFCIHQTYFIVVSYAMQFSSAVENLALSDTVFSLRCIAASYNSRKQCLPGHPLYVDEIKKSGREFSDTLVSVFIPQVHRFFEVPKMEHLPDKHLRKNEILAGFMDFLLQLLFCEVNSDSAEKEQYALLQKELSFLLAVLGDIPFQPCTHSDIDEQVDNLLAEFEMFANEAGAFLFSCVFPIQSMKLSRFHVKTNALLETAKLLNVKIKEHCSIFSELPMSAIVRPRIVDSFFIVDSLVEDLQSIIMNGQLGNFTLDDAMKEQMKTLHIELTLSQSLFKVMQDNDSSKMKEGLIEIRDLAYEAEYLINSLVSGAIHVWYVNLRLPSIVSKIKLVCIGLQLISDSTDGKVTFSSSGSAATLHENQFLDFNHDITQRILMDLTRKLITSRLVVSIFGMPGLGKTTTANKLYNLCSSSFDRRAWCIVSQNYNVRNLLVEIMMCVTRDPDRRAISKKAVAELGVDIHKTLKGRRYLIVLDDIWCSDVLDKLTIYFPDDGNGSRVLITTRNKDVSPDGSILYELPILSKDQCWNLLEKKVFPKDPCPSHLVSIGKRIAAKCSGIPLAVVSIAGVLDNAEREESEWKGVEERLETLLLDDRSNYRKIMELSYHHLPHNIKPCFLYFARFPEDAEISTKELKRFWITQGFVQRDGNRSPEEIAEMYLLDLINRSLVMAAKMRSTGGTKTCRIHDLLHDICIRKAEEENFLNSTNLNSTYGKHQHLCLRTSSNNSWRPFGLHCRSFRGFHTELSPSFQTMALMKFVDLLPKGRESFNDSRGVDLPCQLRYLGISSRLIPKGMVDNLANLEVLHVRSDHLVHLPSVILRMGKLRDLLLREFAKFEEDCNNISETTNLRSISCVVIEKKSDEEILRKSPHLQTLKCIVPGKTMFPDLSSHAALESLSMRFNSSIGADVEIKFPWIIKKLHLGGCGLPWEKMSIVGELPKLQVLKLEYNSFVGEKWETKDDQFYELRFLQIEFLKLKQWSCESYHFPSLERLVVSYCRYLQEIPSDLGYIPTLQRIVVRRNCSKKACLSAIEIEQEQHELGNEELQIDITQHKWTKEELMEELEE